MILFYTILFLYIIYYFIYTYTFFTPSVVCGIAQTCTCILKQMCVMIPYILHVSNTYECSFHSPDNTVCSKLSADLDTP